MQQQGIAQNQLVETSAAMLPPTPLVPFAEYSQKHPLFVSHSHIGFLLSDTLDVLVPYLFDSIGQNHFSTTSKPTDACVHLIIHAFESSASGHLLRYSIICNTIVLKTNSESRHRQLDGLANMTIATVAMAVEKHRLDELAKLDS